MPLVPIKLDSEPVKKPPVPTGFPPRRVEPAPPLDDGQMKFVEGYSLYSEMGSYSSMFTRLFPYQPPAVIFPFQAVFNTLCLPVFMLLLMTAVVTEPEYKPVIAGYFLPQNGHPFWAGFALLLLILIVVVTVRYGWRGRKERWEAYQWESFEQFMRWESWMRYIGAVDILGGVFAFLTIVVLLYKGFL